MGEVGSEIEGLPPKDATDWFVVKTVVVGETAAAIAD
jgi:hypothetical protein